MSCSDRRVWATLPLMGRSPDEPVTGEVARELCQRVGGKAMLAGSISALGNEYVIGLESASTAPLATRSWPSRRALPAKARLLTALNGSASSAADNAGRIADLGAEVCHSARGGDHIVSGGAEGLQHRLEDFLYT